jgi:DNA-binding NtrC family response regulator
MAAYIPAECPAVAPGIYRRTKYMARILVVDDEDSIRMLLSQSLEKQQHEIFDAADGDRALEILSEQEIDVVITDIVMPNREGLETIQDIRANWPDVKIIAISGGGRVGKTNYLELAEKIGATVVLKKPFSLDQLQGAVSTILDAPLWRDG